MSVNGDKLKIKFLHLFALGISQDVLDKNHRLRNTQDLYEGPDRLCPYVEGLRVENLHQASPQERNAN